MKRYIDADVLNAKIDNVLNGHHGYPDDPNNAWDIMAGILRAIPTVNVEPVVHCRDCKYALFTGHGKVRDCLLLPKDEVSFLPGDYFCASGEREEV